MTVCVSNLWQRALPGVMYVAVEVSCRKISALDDGSSCRIVLVGWVYLATASRMLLTYVTVVSALFVDLKDLSVAVSPQ